MSHDYIRARIVARRIREGLVDEQRKDVDEALSDDDAGVDQALRIVQEAAEGNRSMI